MLLQPIVPPHLPGPSEAQARQLRDTAARARAGDAAAQERVRQAAQTVEAHFLTWLLREMRATVPDGGLLPRGPAQETYEQLLDESLAQAIARRGGIGVAKAIEAQLLGRPAPRPTTTDHAPPPAIRAPGGGGQQPKADGEPNHA